MGSKNAAAALRWSRHRLGAVRSLSPAAVIALTLALVIGGAGLADAATGGSFILGRANSESSTASLSNSKGTPLSLSAPSGKAPLAVNRNVLVKNLNAQYVGGLSATSLQATGGDGFTRPNTRTSLPRLHVVVVATTGPLPAGTYYVTATALLYVDPPDSGGFCYITKASSPNSGLSYGGGTQASWVNAAETVAVAVAARDALQERCYASGVNNYADNVGITAIRVLSSSGTPPVSAARPGSATPPGK